MVHHKILTEHIAFPDQRQLSRYEERGGYQAIRKVLKLDPLAVIEEVKLSGLRGRGGAGFATGVKWGFVPRNTAKPVYLLCNADESEPGTFKDRLLIERDPHLVLEGMMIAAFALGAHWSAIYIRGEYAYPATCLAQAIKDAYHHGYLGKKIFGSNYSLDIVCHRGAGAYICGEETGLIESLEGYRGQPRLKPPFPAVVGLYEAPTVINNVETLSALPWIIKNGAAAYAQIGTAQSKGTKLMSLSGQVKHPGVYEIDLGYPLRDFINNEGGGMHEGHTLKAVIPGGSSVPVLRADELDGVLLDYESLRDAGSMLGSGGMIVLDESADMVEVAANLQHFYSAESCGQCTPCREGGHWVEKVIKRINEGAGLPTDLALLESVCGQIAGHTICPFGDALVTPVLSLVKKFRTEFEEKISAALDKHLI